MLYSIVDAVGTGSLQTVAVPPYLSKTHISVYVNGNPSTAWSWVTDQTVQLVAPLGAPVRVARRTSPEARLSDYRDGTPLPGDVLDVDSKQAFYLAQEALDLATIGGALISVPLGNLGIELTTSQLLDLLTGWLTPSQFALSLQAEIAKISGSDAVIGSVAWRVLQEANARAAAISSEATARATAILAEAGNRTAAINTERTIRETAEAALASEITVLAAGLDGNIAAVLDEQTARIDGDTALASSITALTATVAGVSASVTSEATARASADSALSTRVSSLEAAVITGGGYDDTELRARITDAEEAIVDEATARATAVSALAATVTAGDAASAALVTAEATTRATADTSLANRAAALEAKVDLATGETVSALIAEEATARADADSAQASDITTLQSSVTGLTTGLASVQTQANTSTTQLGVVNANWSVKVQARTDSKYIVAGLGLNSTVDGTTGVAQSEFVVLADKFFAASSVNGTLQPLFVSGLVDGVNTFVIPGTLYGDQSVAARMIVDGAILTRHLRVTGGVGASLWGDPNGQEPEAWRVSAWGSKADFATTTSGISGNTVIRTGGPVKSVEGYPYVPAVVGRRYRASCRARGSSYDGSFYFKVAYADIASPSAPAALEVATGVAADTSLDSSWREFAFEFDAPAGAKFISPFFILNYGGTTGFMEVQDVRIKEMLDDALIVDGGIRADKIDTRGLTIKDSSGTILFGAGTNLDWSKITPATSWLNSNISLNADGSLAGAGGGAVTLPGLGAGAFATLNQINSANVATYIAAAAIGNAQIGGDIWSSNYVPATSGWIIQRDGYAEFANVKVRGDVQATSLNGVLVGTGNVVDNAITDNVASASVSVPQANNTTPSRTHGTVAVTVPSGARVLIMARGWLQPVGSSRGILYFRINGARYNAVIDSNNGIVKDSTFFLLDSLSGSTTFEWETFQVSGTGGVNTLDASFIVLLLKK